MHRQQAVRIGHQLIGIAAAEAQEAQHPLANPKLAADAGADLQNLAGHLQAGRERQRRFHLIFSSDLQGVGEIEAGCAHTYPNLPICNRGTWQLGQGQDFRPSPFAADHGFHGTVSDRFILGAVRRWRRWFPVR